MGRVKLEIKKIENTNNRLVTFAKRKAGLIKKAQELSTLCDIDLALIMFSPGNKVTQYATNSRIEEILFRYANVPEAERTKRKMENLEQLNRAIRKLKGENEASNFTRQFLASKGDFSGIEEEIRRLQASNEVMHARIRLFQGDEALVEACNYEDLLQMEMEVQSTLDKVRMRRQELQYVDFNTTNKDPVDTGAAFGGFNACTDRDIEMVKYLQHGKEEAAGSSEHSSSPGSYFGDQARSSFAAMNLNQVEFPYHHPPEQQQQAMSVFDMGCLSYDNNGNNLEIPTYFQQHQGVASNGYLDELESESQVDSSQ